MTRLDAIKARYPNNLAAYLRALYEAGETADDLGWLLAQVEALAGALRQIDAIATAHYRGAIGDAQDVARAALAALEAPDA